MLFLPELVHCSAYLWTGYKGQAPFRGFSVLSNCASPSFCLSMDWRREAAPFFEAFPHFLTVPVHRSAYLWTGGTIALRLNYP